KEPEGPLGHARKMVMKACVSIVALAATAFLAIASAQGGQARGGAQPAPAQRVQVQVTHVKFDQVDAYQNLVKTTLLPAIKKANIASYVWTWANGASGEAGEFVQVRPIKNYAEFDIPNRLQAAMGTDAPAAFNAKIRPMIVKRETFIQTIRPDLSIQSAATTPPPLAVVQIFQVNPGK